MATVTLVTGAGASHKLGTEAGLPPLMPGWAADLCGRLGEHAELLGLTTEMSSEQFEERLGAFLRFTRSLPDVADYPGAGVADGGDVEEFSRWFEQADETARAVMEAVFTSLHELFGRSRIDADAATTAYGELLARLNAERLYYATTNYDVAAEIALGRLGRRPYTGLDASWFSGEPQHLHLDDLLANDTQRTPVLHLHGCVGWYIADDGSPIATEPDAEFSAELGTPALLLPDPDKVYDDVVSEAIWRQFSVALSQTDLVLVVGHSLADPQLRNALAEVPDEKLGITIHALPGATSSAWTTQESTLVNFLERRPHVIPMDFQANPCADRERLSRYLSGVAADYSSSSSVAPLHER